MPFKLGARHKSAPKAVPPMRERVRLAQIEVREAVDHYSALDLRGDDALPDALGNDNLSNCVPCAVLRLMQLWWSHTGDKGRRPSHQEAVALYSRFAGYDPGNQATDLGTYTADAYVNWGRSGYVWSDQLQIVPRWVKVKEDREAFDATEAKFAIDRFGGILATMSMPASALENMQIWVDPPPGTDDSADRGLHEVLVAGYDRDWWYVVSWGRLIRVGYPFMLRRTIASQAFLSLNAWLLPTGRTIAGLDFDRLALDAQQLQGM